MSREQDVSEDVIGEVFEKFEKDIKRLTKIPETTETKTKKLLELLYDEEHDVFNESWEFVQILDELSEEVGHAAVTVLIIELARQRISSPQSQDFMSSFQSMLQQRTNQPLVIQPSAPTQLSWLGTYFYSRALRDAAKAMVESGKKETPGHITTEKEVSDILEWGRQLVPNFNLLREVFEIDLVALNVCGFNDVATKENLRSELRLFLSNLIGVIRTFSRCASEYRVELVGDRSRDIAKAVFALKQAEYQAMGGLNPYKLMREYSGAQDAGH